MCMGRLNNVQIRFWTIVLRNWLHAFYVPSRGTVKNTTLGKRFNYHVRARDCNRTADTTTGYRAAASASRR